MKIRTDFVTNSSSSSYIVAFDKIPKTEGEVKAMLFGEKRTTLTEETWSEGEDDILHPIAEMHEFLSHFLKSKPLSDEELIEEFEGGWLNGAPEYPYKSDYKTDKEHEEAISQYKKDSKKHTETIMKEFKKRSKGKHFYSVSVGDNHGEFRGGPYSKLDYEGDRIFVCPSFKISNH